VLPSQPQLHWSKGLFGFTFSVSHDFCRYIAAELLELGSKNSDLQHRRVITARDICLAIREDAELQQCFGAFEIGGVGVQVNSHNIISIQEYLLKE
jgi:hypothetical protein